MIDKPILAILCTRMDSAEGWLKQIGILVTKRNAGKPFEGELIWMSKPYYFIFINAHNPERLQGLNIATFEIADAMVPQSLIAMARSRIR